MSTFGGYTVSTFVSDYFYLDGGAMFGVVPKTIWGKSVAADPLNRIRLSCRLLLLEGAGRRILVDAGCGSDWSDKKREIYGFEPQCGKPLHEIIPGVTDVVLSHMHFDHAGGCVYRSSGGELRLCYPSAVHHVQAGNFEHGRRPSLREKASYEPAPFELLKQARLNLIEGAAELFPGIQVFPSDGHTRGMQWLLAGEGREGAAFPSDLLPSVHHIHLPFITSYDMRVEETVNEKQDFLTRAAAEQWRVVFYHDPQIPAGRIGRDRFGRFVLSEKVEIPSYGC